MKHNKILRWLPICMALVVALACGGCRQAESVDGFRQLEKQGIVVTSELLLGDTLALPDEYVHIDSSLTAACAKPMPMHGVELTQAQCGSLINPAGQSFRSEMGKCLLLGVRQVDDDHVLAAYYMSNPLGYSVYLMTYDTVGNICDAIDAREFHVLWPVKRELAGESPDFTLDSYITFADKRSLTLHRQLAVCDMDYEKEMKGAPQWQLCWNQEYRIDEKGVFVFVSQHDVLRQGDIDHCAEVNYKAWDLLVCSQHDTAIMDAWNDFVPQLESFYEPDDVNNPYRWNLPHLYRSNPQRFDQWMKTHPAADNHLARYAAMMKR